MLNTTLIREQMQVLGLSQTGLAEQCEVSREAVSNWMSGDSVPRPKKVRRLSEVLGLAVEALFTVAEVSSEPIVAYRTRRNRPVTGSAKEAAEDIGRHLRELVPFIQREPMFVPPVLESPALDEVYMRETTRQVRERVGVSATAPLARVQLLDLHRHFGSILVPVLWDKTKDGHENALSVLLPDSRTSWVLFSLNAKDDDFNYWLAHELGHCYSLHILRDNEGEAFAEAFAQELLFPSDVAERALVESIERGGFREHATWCAGKYDISVVTVLKQMEKVAKRQNLGGVDVVPNGFWAEWSAGRAKMPTVAGAMLDNPNLTVEEYVVGAEDVFRTPVFRALAQWQLREGKSPAFMRSALNLDIVTAMELSAFLMVRHEQIQSGTGAFSPNSRS